MKFKGKRTARENCILMQHAGSANSIRAFPAGVFFFNSQRSIVPRPFLINCYGIILTLDFYF
jgi:hypothetical protein